MENEDTRNNQRETPSEPSQITSKKQTRKERSKANAIPEKPDQDKKKSYRRSWRSTSPIRKIEIIIGGIVAAGAIGYLGVTVWSTLQTKWNFQAEHKPIVVNIRPPQIQFFSCNPPGFSGEVITGNIDTHIKNIGNATARKVNPYAIMTKLIPETKSGNKFIDDAPTVTDESCKHPRFKIPGIELSLDPGRESGAGIRQTAGTIPFSVENSPMVDFYLVSCVYYADESGADHGTCDRYRLNVPVKPKPFGLDNLSGTPSIPCDGSTVTGQFVPDVIGHCEE
jgi:hypothetical protein